MSLQNSLRRSPRIKHDNNEKSLYCKRVNDIDLVKDFICLPEDFPLYSSFYKQGIYDIPWGSWVNFMPQKSNFHFHFHFEFTIPLSYILQGLFTCADIRKIIIKQKNTRFQLSLDKDEFFCDNNIFQSILFELFRNTCCIMKNYGKYKTNNLYISEIDKGRSFTLFCLDIDLSDVNMSLHQEEKIENIMDYYLAPYFLLSILWKYDKTTKNTKKSREELHYILCHALYKQQPVKQNKKRKTGKTGKEEWIINIKLDVLTLDFLQRKNPRAILFYHDVLQKKDDEIFVNLFPFLKYDFTYDIKNAKNENMKKDLEILKNKRDYYKETKQITDSLSDISINTKKKKSTQEKEKENKNPWLLFI